MTTRNEAKNENPAAFLAFDWADAAHAYALAGAGEPQVESGQVEHDPGRLGEFIGELRRRFGGRPVAVIIEQKRGALMHALLGHDHLWLYPVNPKALARFRETFSGSGAKDDPTDARLLLDLLRKHRDRLHCWLPGDAQSRALGLLVEERRRAVNERTRLVEQLLACLKNYYPQAIDLLGAHLETALACKLLQKWPDFESLSRARAQTIRNFFYAHRFRRADIIEQRLEKLSAASALTTDSAVIEVFRVRARRLTSQLLALLPHIASCDKRIAELFAAHPDAPIFQSLPGAGPALAPRLLAAFSQDRNQWRDASHLATFSGIAPVKMRSGNRSITVFRRAAPKFLRQSFHEFANASKRFSPWARRYYLAKRENGLSHHRAVRALAFKWIRIIHACWRSRAQYDPNKYPPERLHGASA